MRGLITLHPVDPDFLDYLIVPLMQGEKVNPEAYLDQAIAFRTVAWRAAAYRLSLAQELEALKPPPPPAEGSLWTKVRTRLERFDFKPDPLAALVGRKIEPELHLEGRPFLITENGADRIARVCDDFQLADDEEAVDTLIGEQLKRLDAGLGAIEPVDQPALGASMAYRSELLAELKSVYDMARKERFAEIPWRAVRLHGHAVPCWVARDVDGLATLCAASGIDLPEGARPGRTVLSRAGVDHDGWHEAGLELEKEQDLGLYVAPDRIPDLLDFLTTQGARMIQAATQHGVGSTCATLLKKIRECAQYARHRGVGYIEASGIVPLDREADPALEAAESPF